MCLRLCCDPHKLTYISAIVTACEAVLFGALNLTLILLSKCVIKPPDKRLGGGLDDFYSYYYFSNESCYDRYGDDYTIPGWVKTDYPIVPRPKETSVDANFGYQVAYLTLHAFWVLSCFVLLYGNARKKWGYYIPWLIICFTFTIMDVTIAAFFIIDMMDVLDIEEGDSFTTRTRDVSAMIWSFVMYLRIFLFWFLNLGHVATGMNAFCKTRHKRSKQERRRKKQEKKHQRELAEAEVAAAAQARAEATAEAQAQAQAVVLVQIHSPHASPQSASPQSASPRSASPQPASPQPTSPQPTSPPHPEAFDNPGFQDTSYYHEQPPPYSPPLHPLPSVSLPKEVRPFSYLNPTFRPTDAHDVVGMKANASDAIASPKKGQGGFFSAIPPADYDDDDQDPLPPSSPQGAFPRANLSNGRSADSFRSGPRDDAKEDYNRNQKSGYY